MRSQYRRLIEVQAQNFSLDPDLLEAQVLVESGDHAQAFRWEPAFWATYLEGKPSAATWGPLGACSFGLLQILGQVALERGFSGSPQDLFTPATGLFLGAKQLAWLQKQVGDPHAAIAAYNGGLVGNTAAPFRNQQYLDRVLITRAQWA